MSLIDNYNLIITCIVFISCFIISFVVLSFSLMPFNRSTSATYKVQHCNIQGTALYTILSIFDLLALNFSEKCPTYKVSHPWPFCIKFMEQPFGDLQKIQVKLKLQTAQNEPAHLNFTACHLVYEFSI